MKRRGLLQAGVVLLGGAITSGMAVLAAAVGRSTSRWPRHQEGGWHPLARLDELPDGETSAAEYSFYRLEGWYWQKVSRNVFVARQSDEATVFSRVCTHLGCQIKLRTQEPGFKCNCHGAVFDAEGEVVEGPAPLPLVRLTHRVEAGILEVQES